MRGTGSNIRRWSAAVALISIAIAAVAWASESLNRLELDSVDARFSVRGAEPPPDDVAVVAIDALSFNQLQERWPFPRSLHGRMIRTLDRMGANAIVYDVQFTEPTSPREDNALISAVADAGVPVILATEEVNRDGDTNVFGGEEVLAGIGARAANSGFEPDPGGVFRRVAHSIDGLDTIAVATVEQRDGVRVGPGGFSGRGAWIDFYGPPRTIPTYSFSRVLRGRVAPDAFRGKTVVVGVSVPSVQDVHPVPTSGDKLMAGVEIQANAIATVARNLPLRDTSWPIGALLIVLLGAVAPVAGMWLRPLPAAGLAVAVAAAFLVAVQVAFNAGRILPFVYPLLALALATVGMLAVHYAIAAFERRRVRDTFARFVPEDVVDEVLARTDGDLRLGGSRRVVTVLFSDIRGFTAFSETQPPDRVVAVLNRYLGAMTDAIMARGGTLVAFMGDGIMAVFGAPLDQPDHADRALAAARDMSGPVLAEFNRWLVESGSESGFRIGIGLNSGEVMAGQVGSERRVEYTTIGDTTNTAARLEAMTKDSDHSLFVSGSCHAMLTDSAGLVFVEELEVRGRSEKVGVWTLGAKS